MYLNLFVVDENPIGSLTATKIWWVPSTPFGICSLLATSSVLELGF